LSDKESGEHNYRLNYTEDYFWRRENPTARMPLAKATEA
jgi:hypothetical protein